VFSVAIFYEIIEEYNTEGAGQIYWFEGFAALVNSVH